MRLVTAMHAGREFAGAWIDDDRLIGDLARAATTRAATSSSGA